MAANRHQSVSQAEITPLCNQTTLDVAAIHIEIHQLPCSPRVYKKAAHSIIFVASTAICQDASFRGAIKAMMSFVQLQCCLPIYKQDPWWLGSPDWRPVSEMAAWGEGGGWRVAVWKRLIIRRFQTSISTLLLSCHWTATVRPSNVPRRPLTDVKKLSLSPFNLNFFS